MTLNCDLYGHDFSYLKVRLYETKSDDFVSSKLDQAIKEFLYEHGMTITQDQIISKKFWVIMTYGKFIRAACSLSPMADFIEDEEMKDILNKDSQSYVSSNFCEYSRNENRQTSCCDKARIDYFWTETRKILKSILGERAQVLCVLDDFRGMYIFKLHEYYTAPKDFEKDILPREVDKFINEMVTYRDGFTDIATTENIKDDRLSDLKDSVMEYILDTRSKNWIMYEKYIIDTLIDLISSLNETTEYPEWRKIPDDIRSQEFKQHCLNNLNYWKPYRKSDRFYPAFNDLKELVEERPFYGFIVRLDL